MRIQKKGIGPLQYEPAEELEELSATPDSAATDNRSGGKTPHVSKTTYCLSRLCVLGYWTMSSILQHSLVCSSFRNVRQFSYFLMTKDLELARTLVIHHNNINYS